jgi:para-aminobenzoate synthetase component 1
MVIRTVVFDASQVRIGVGGGITSDSVPADELEETRLKARALLEALGLEDPWSW